MAYEPRTFQAVTANTPPTGTDPMVDNTANGDVQAIKIIDATAGSTTPLAGQKARAISLSVTLSTEDVAALTPPGAISGFATSANQSTIIGHLDGVEAALALLLAEATFTGRVGEVQASPTANTVLARLKTIGDALAAALTVSGTIEVTNDVGNPLPVNGTVTANLGTLNGAATAANQATLISQTDGIEGSLSSIDTKVATETTLATLLTLAGFQARINTLGQKTAANSTPVVLASDQSAIALDSATLAALETINAAQSGTWTMQPGNTPNTTPWLVKEGRSATGTTTSVNDAATSTTLLASNANRLGASVYNDSTVDLYLKLGATASTTSFTQKMAPGGMYEVPFGYTGIIDGIWASDASGAARITEYT